MTSVPIDTITITDNPPNWTDMPRVQLVVSVSPEAEGKLGCSAADITEVVASILRDGHVWTTDQDEPSRLTIDVSVTEHGGVPIRAKFAAHMYRNEAREQIVPMEDFSDSGGVDRQHFMATRIPALARRFIDWYRTRWQPRKE